MDILLKTITMILIYNGNIKITVEEFLEPKENNIVSKYHSWANLIEESKDLNPAFVLSSLDIHPSGFKTDDPQAQMVLDTAFTKKVDEIIDVIDENGDEKTFRVGQAIA